MQRGRIYNEAAFSVPDLFEQVHCTPLKIGRVFHHLPRQKVECR